MENNVVVRPAEPRDLEVIGKLGGDLVRVHHRFDGQRFMSPSPDVDEGYAWFLGTQLRDKDVIILVAERAGQILGYVYAGLEPMSWKELRDPAGFVHDVVVVEEARGQGIATRLVQAAAAWLEDHGAPRVMLWTAEKNGAARRLFERMGFRATMIEMTRERG